MIPQRVKLAGFLCYKEDQAIDFQGAATLWMLSGLNGSGKSAIFDAVTFSLFGHHRGGASGAVELINKDSDALLVEFEFLLDGKLFRAKRTLKRDTKGGAKSTFGLYRHDDGKWAAVPGTAQKREFDSWIAENIGLNYDTFTSSVLLLQGKADKLLDSRPEGRREVLASIVDLERYERLHQKADEKRKALDGTVKALNGRLAALPSVLPLEIGAARLRIAEAEQARQAARDEVERWQAMQTQARLWQSLQAQLHAAKRKHARALSLLAESAEIEKGFDRLRELRDVLPRLQEIAVSRGQASQAGEALATLSTQRERRAAARAEKESAVRQAEERRRTLQSQIDRQAVEHAGMGARLRKLGEQLVTLKEAERAETELESVRAESALLPADPAALVASARQALERLEGVARLVPALERFRRRRDELAGDVQAEKAAQKAMESALKQGTARKADAERLKAEAEKAAAFLRQAAEAAAEARTLAQQARQALAELSQLEGAKTCRHCGQALTPGHVDEEKQKRGAEARRAEEKARQTAGALEAAKAAEADALGRAQAAEQACQEARDEWKSAKAALDQAGQAIERSQRDCAGIRAELPDEAGKKVAQGQVSDWLATRWPEASDVEALRAEGKGADKARKALREAEGQQHKHAALKSKEESLAANVDRLGAGLPTDRKKFRQDHADLEHQEKALYKAMDAGRANVAQAEKEIQKLGKERDAAVAELGQAEAGIREQQLVQQNAQRNIGAMAKALPPSWQPMAETVGLKQHAELAREREALQARGVDEQARELELARGNLDEMRRAAEQLEKEEAGYPPEARGEPEEIGKALRGAQAGDQRSETELSGARQQLALMESYEAQRAEVRAELASHEEELQSYKLLAELLGRDRLQLYLVRQAEKQVVEYANAVLDRLSGGQLYMRLSGEACGEAGTGKALELEAYNRATGEKPINVAFLSGSQKFRVAVSLALGIGQYASRQHRPIESVIIDEGFGCLDSQGRQVMIQELQNLRSQMRCILLVSHQEDFAEAFSDGYQFKLENGATRVTRFQK